MLNRDDIRIRDPYIVTDKENGCYYMYGTTALKDGSLAASDTFSVYKSYDLEVFEEPVTVFDGSKIGFWADRDYWAPEVHKYNGKYYLFGSFKTEDRLRATQILASDTPSGEFKPISDEPITPSDMQCLDGTLYVENGTPYIVFCHEWVQIGDGEIMAMALSDDLTHPVGEPFLLFRASEAVDVSEIKVGDGNYVTDGPFLFNEDGRVKMIWSSLCNGRYVILLAESDSIHGKWIHHGSQFDFDGGHAMLFYTLNGERKISLHSPNKAGKERLFITDY